MKLLLFTYLDDIVYAFASSVLTKLKNNILK